MESTVADYELGGVVRTRSGGILRDVAPANAYPTADGHDVVIAGNADAVFARLSVAMERPDLATDVRHARGAGRAPGSSSTTRSRVDATTLGRRAHRDVAGARRAGRADQPGARPLAADPHIAAREMIVRLAAGFDTDVPMTGVVPKFSRTPGAIRHVGPALGAHTDDVLRELGGVLAAEIAALRDAGVVGRWSPSKNSIGRLSR